MERQRKYLIVEMPESWLKKLKTISKREQRSIKTIVTHALKPVVKSGKSGIES